MVVAKKKDGKLRICCDFRKLNKITTIKSWPLPLTDDILSLLGNAVYMSSLDARSAYWAVELDDDDKEKATFVCHRGVFSFNVMAFGLSNAPSIFQQLMATVLKGFQTFALAYLDDILVFSKSAEEHMHHLQLVLDRLREHDIKLKLQKCSFFTKRNYLGFVFTETGVKPDLQKVQAIQNLPEPKTVKEVRAAPGLFNWYRRFIPNLAETVIPLVALTKKNVKFVWSIEQQIAFDLLK